MLGFGLVVLELFVIEMAVGGLLLFSIKREEDANFWGILTA